MSIAPHQDATAALAPYIDALTEVRAQFPRDSEDWCELGKQLEVLKSTQRKLEEVMREAGISLVVARHNLRGCSGFHGEGSVRRLA